MTEREINGMPVIGVCQRCGREFLTMPLDGRDHWGVKRYKDRGPVECGGFVELIRIDGEEQSR